MSIFHCSIKIINRSGGRSAVASAAYRAGEKLYNDETGIVHDFTRKDGIVMNEILLPENAPLRFLEREVLWNEVQKIEKRSDAQFAREIEVSLPTEMKRDEQIACVRAYIQENFVSKGMIADWTLHDKGVGNPHVHIMLTMRGIDDHEQRMQKQKTVFANTRDEQGRAVYDPSLPCYDPKDKEHTSQYRIPALDKDGNQKKRERKGKGTEYLWEKISIPANDWNSHALAEIWRASWAEHCNRYLDREHHIDHRSYERQGLDRIPTIHEGVTARQMEKEGKIFERCEINRDIRQRNLLRQQLKEIAAELTRLVTEKARALYERIKEFRRNTRNAERAGTDAGYPGETAGRDRGTLVGESGFKRTAGRINELKRTAGRTGEEIDRTESEIAGTDQRIKELRQLAAGREAERNERLRKLKERRNAYNSGRIAGRERETAGSDIRSAADDVSAFIRKLRAEERTAEEKRDDSFTERSDREAERERSRAEEERAARAAEQRAAAQRAERQGRSRGRGIGR